MPPLPKGRRLRSRRTDSRIPKNCDRCPSSGAWEAGVLTRIAKKCDRCPSSGAWEAGVLTHAPWDPRIMFIGVSYKALFLPDNEQRSTLEDPMCCAVFRSCFQMKRSNAKHRTCVGSLLFSAVFVSDCPVPASVLFPMPDSGEANRARIAQPQPRLNRNKLPFRKVQRKSVTDPILLKGWWGIALRQWAKPQGL